jgi:two-component system, cell cycle response regulator CpdR
MRPSSVLKRSIVIHGHKTSISLEDAFWQALNEIADARRMRRSELIATVERSRERSNLSSALRLFVLDTFRRRAEGADLRSRKVLVVDDEPLVLQLARNMLENLGWDVRTAPDGTQALAEIERDHGIEVLIADFEMPGMSGNQLGERAKKLRSRLKIILMSGRETAPHGLPLIRKPFLEADLKRVLSATGLS